MRIVMEPTVKNIIHALRTPLVVIKIGVTTVYDCLPQLIEAYQLAKEQGMPVKQIPQHKLEMLKKLLENSEKEIGSINEYINGLVKK